MEHKELVEQLRKANGYSKAETQKLISAVARQIKEHAPLMESVSIQGFGIFEPRKKLERISVNPVSGIRMLIPPKITLSFRPATAIKKSLKARRPQAENGL